MLSSDGPLKLPADDEPRRRVRFVGADRSEERGRVSITVNLEWEGVVGAGRAVGDRGAAIELKTAARAAVAAIEELAGQSIDTRVIGVKPIHAFDSELVVVSLVRDVDEPHRLLGTVVVSDDPIAATALAVLSALNRALGNFLHTSD